jgi:hypothetical protein
MTSTEDGARALPRTNAKHWVGVTADDIPQGWMDDMVRRLFDVLNRSMIELETAAVPVLNETNSETAKRKALLDDAARKTKLANQMQQALERLTEMETKRVSTRNARIGARSYDDARKELKRQLEAILGEPENGRDLPGA